MNYFRRSNQYYRKVSQKFSASEIRLQLMSSDESIAMNAIEQLKSNGKSSAIAPLLEALALSEHNSVKKEAREMLSAMRVKNAEEELVQALFDSKLKGIQVEILQFLWSNGFSAAGQLHTLVEVAIGNGLQGMLELLSILEVEEGVYSEEEQLGAMSFLRSTNQDNFSREEKIIFNDILRAIDTLIINE
ncbi:MAG: hypothetical protein RJA38_966 [Bacteroidota bacterium]|jgi:hypothetical protein